MRVFPRPVSPVAAWRDLKAFLGSRTPHQLGFAVLSVAIPLFWLGLFYLDQVPMEYRPPEIIYVKKYDPNRTDEEIKAQQKIDTAERKKREAEEQKILEERRAPFKAIDKKMDELGL
jgi:hypothetical protein